ncbi:MAG: RHS repeat-associated core domain-containing protein [Candidatus Omnitrophota bacterium]
MRLKKYIFPVLLLVFPLCLSSLNFSYAENADASGLWNYNHLLSPITIHVVSVATYPGGSSVYTNDQPMSSLTAGFTLEVSQSQAGVLSGSSNVGGYPATLIGNVSGNNVTFTYTATVPGANLTCTGVCSGTINGKNISGTLTYTFSYYNQTTVGDVTVTSTASGSTIGSFTVAITRVDLDTFLTSCPAGTIEEPVAAFAWRGVPEEKIARYEYSLDGSAKVSTTDKGITLNGLSETEHIFSVAAVNKLGNVDPTPATCTFTVRKKWAGQPNLEESNRGNQPGKSTSDPINFVTGNMYVIAQDLALPGRGLDFKFSRTYNGLNKDNGPLGYGWTHSYNIPLSTDQASGLSKITDEEGKSYSFGINGDSITAQRGDHSRFLTNGSNITWRKKDGTEYLFDSSRRLTSIKDRIANQLNLEYDAKGSLVKIIDTVGRQITFSYDSQNRIIFLNDPSGNNFNYAYDANGNLVKVTNPKGESTFYEYDANHNLTKKTDAKGNTVSFAYDSSNRCISSNGDNNHGLTQLSYDPDNKKTVVADSKGKTTAHYYNADFELTRSVDSAGKEVFSNWDANFNLISRTDELSRTTAMEYDAMGNLSKLTDPLGNSTVFVYEPNFSLLISTTDAQGNNTIYNRDSKGNLLEVKDALGNSTTYAYNSFGQPLTVTNPLGKITYFSYGAKGNLETTKDALGNTTTFKYDDSGNLTETTDVKGNTTKYTYNELNQLIKVVYTDDSYLTYEYDAVGNRAKVTDQNSNSTTYIYDQNNRVISVTDPQGHKVNYDYDTEGNLISVIDQSGNKTTYSYSSFNRLIEESDALGNKAAYEYDSVGNRTKKTTPEAKEIKYEYDSLNRLTKVIYPDNTLIYGYDSLGRRTSLTDKSGITHYFYDSLSRLTKVDGPLDNDTIEHAYNSLGNRISMIDPDQKLTRYAYDELNRLSVITDPQDKITKYEYDSLGNLTGLLYANGLKTTYSYDSLNHLTNLTTQNSANPLEKFSEFIYIYDKAGRRISAQLPDGKIDYSYDSKGQLTQEKKTGSKPYQISYEYDPAGNRSSMLKDGIEYTYLYNDLNQLIEENISSPAKMTTSITVRGKVTVTSGIKSLTVNGTQATLSGSDFSCPITLLEGKNTITVRATDNNNRSSSKSINVTYAPTKQILYSYDLNGNLIKKERAGKTTNYTYDLENRLLHITGGNLDIAYQYDAEGKRISSTQGSSSTNYLYDGLSVILERNSQGQNLTSYIRNPLAAGGIGGIIKEATPIPGYPDAYYHYDGQDNVTVITGSSAERLMSASYDSFGNLLEKSGIADNSYKFSTKETDPSGLIYFGARYYDPRIGRFITRDPLGMVNGPNLYLYCLNDPLNWIDPWGLCVEAGYSKLIDLGIFSIRHTFIKATYQGQTRMRGFVPTSSFWAVYTVLTGWPVPGRIREETGVGEFIKLKIQDSAQAMIVYNLLEPTEQLDWKSYDYLTQDCYDWRNQILLYAGIKPPDDWPGGQ